MPERWLQAHRLMNLESLGVIGGALLGYAVVSLASYAWHRSAHTFPLMWRLFHQIHHSPQRVDMSGAALFHPLETIVFFLMSAIVTTLMLGLDPVAAALTGYIAAFYGYFQHMNVRTPQWLGVVIQRPEAHCIHHQRDVHAYNYGDLPIWDMLFGTFRNPASFEGPVGFDKPATDRIGAMLGFVDVNEPVAGPDTLGGTLAGRVDPIGERISSPNRARSRNERRAIPDSPPCASTTRYGRGHRNDSLARRGNRAG